LRKAVLGGLARADLSETLTQAGLSSLQALAGQPVWRLRDALHFLHHPATDVPLQALEDRAHPAWLRLKAEELLAQQLSQRQARQERDAMRAPVFDPSKNADWAAVLMQALPFKLTSAQERVTAEIGVDLTRPVPMHRLLQGDVGSGKTVVAAVAACRAMSAGWQCALMAPTEILAQQHFAKLVQWLEPLLKTHGRTVAWLTGSQTKRVRTGMLAQIASGEAALVIGTHALIQDTVSFARLGLVIIDEQHRFGVAQRLSLRRKLLQTTDGQALSPHLLMMTATPIPRTLAMSYYADLDVSTIDELPPGRTPIVTRVLSSERRLELIERIREQVNSGRQVYWVCPLIEESEALDLRHATQAHEELSQALADGTGVGLMHGRLPPAEKQAVMAAFVAGTCGFWSAQRSLRWGLMCRTRRSWSLSTPNALASANCINCVAVSGVARRPQRACCCTSRRWAMWQRLVCAQWHKPTTVLSCLVSTSSCGVPGRCWVHANPAPRFCVLLISAKTMASSVGRVSKPKTCWPHTPNWRSSIWIVGWGVKWSF